MRRLPAALLLALQVLATPAAAAPPAASEYELKAAFLFNFAKFVEWPADVFTGADALTVCVLGDDPFGNIIDRALAAKSVHDRPLVVRRHQRLDQTGGCHILFISAPEEGRLGRFTPPPGPVLTVGETRNFLKQGGIVAFGMNESRLRFEINADAADQAGLKISSQLMKLATRIVRKAS